MRGSFILLILGLCLGCQPDGPKQDSIETIYFHSNSNLNRPWLGPQFWANRLQDWQLESGQLQCIGGQFDMRTVHHISKRMPPETGSLEMSVFIYPNSAHLKESAFAGFLIGAGKWQEDYRIGLLTHQCPGKDAGLILGMDSSGKLFAQDNEGADSLRIIPEAQSLFTNGWPATDTIQLNLLLQQSPDKAIVHLTAYNQAGDSLGGIDVIQLSESHLSGSLALISHQGADETGRSWKFSDWQIKGTKLEQYEGRDLGPVIATQHTLSKGILKMTAQMAPVGQQANQQVHLEIKEGKQWKKAQSQEIVYPGYTATFRIENWDPSSEKAYRIAYTYRAGDVPAYYEGLIRAEPALDKELVVAGFTGNNQTHGTFNRSYSFNRSRIWFPHEDLAAAVASQQPDMLFFSGDQLYEGRPTWPDRRPGDPSYLDYLYKWYLFLWSFRDLMRDIPSITIPDDHDVYHGNVWGAGGKKPDPDLPLPAHYSDRFKGHWIQDQGGYRMPAEFVQMVDRTQTHHLPDPFDPSPIEQGIGVYYTNMTYGGVSFAILEDRKFKSAPTTLMPEAQVINGFSQIKGYDTQKLDHPDAVLLGARQLAFLEAWAEDWEGAWMKSTLSQTIFANVSTYPDTFLTDAGTPRLQPLEQGVIPKDYRVAKDMDSNGWPQAGRNRALRAIRKGFGFMYAGDQHLGTLVHHGIDSWRDAGYSFCVPSVANLWPRRWFPQQAGANHEEGMPLYTGDYLDGFGNHITVWAASNPYISSQEPKALHDRAPGYGIVRFNKKSQQIEVECWPRYVDPSQSREQYPGWPRTLELLDQFGAEKPEPLAEVRVSGLANLPVVWVFEEDGKTLHYARRMQAMNEKISVLRAGNYILKIGEPGTEKVKQFDPLKSGTFQELQVSF